MLPTVQLSADTAAEQTSRNVFDTRRDDPFASMDRIDWPGPNRYRSSSGVPGPDYWQQRADYTINASLDTATTQISGAVEIRYTNNSPDTLRYVWVQADQNLYRTGSKGSALFPADSRWGVRGFEGGYTFSDIRINGAAVQPRINDTMMRLDLPSPLIPRGGKATIAIRYSFRVPQHGSDRMGRDSLLYEIAQWYPRMAVYDDVHESDLGPLKSTSKLGSVDLVTTWVDQPGFARQSPTLEPKSNEVRPLAPMQSVHHFFQSRNGINVIYRTQILLTESTRRNHTTDAQSSIDYN